MKEAPLGPNQVSWIKGVKRSEGAVALVGLPRRHHTHDARRQLDVHDLTRCATLALNPAHIQSEERMPAIVDYDILPDMGTMTVRLSSDERHGSSQIRRQEPRHLRAFTA